MSGDRSLSFTASSFCCWQASSYWCRSSFLLLPRPTIRRVVVGTLLVLVGVFMMRWNVVIGCQAFSASFAGFMEYRLPIWPESFETYKEGLLGALTVGIAPFILFWIMCRIFPVFLPEERR